MLLCERLSVGDWLRGMVFLNAILLQCKQERLGVGGLVRGWNRASVWGWRLVMKAEVREITFLGSAPGIVCWTQFACELSSVHTQQFRGFFSNPLVVHFNFYVTLIWELNPQRAVLALGVLPKEQKPH